MASIYQSVIANYIPWESGHRREFARNLLLQIYFTFVQSALMVSMLGLFAGAAIAVQTNFGLALLGTNDQLGKLLVFIIFREVTPLVASMLMIARSGTAVAAEMATIKVQQEVEALNIMGINVYHYVLAPRIFGGAVSLFCMACNFLFFAALGGWIGANVNSYFPLTQYITSVAQSIRTWDFLFFFLKTFIVGGVVMRIACNRGLSLQNAPFEVPIVPIRAVVAALTVGMGVHFTLSVMYYVIFGIDL